MNFIEKSLKYKQVTLSVLFLFFVVGVYSLFNMSRREDPKVTPTQGLVIAYYPGASSAQVEEQVTKKLEQTLFKYEEINKTKTISSSQDGRVVITAELAKGVTEPDIFWSKLRQELMVVKQTDLPKGVVGPIVNSDFGDTEAMILGISGKNIPYDQLKEYTKKLEDNLRSIPAVSKIKRDGELEEQILVATSSAKLAQFGLNQQDVIRTLQSQNDIFASGDIEINAIKVPLYTKGYYNTMEELGNQIIGNSQSGSVVRLKDIAILSRTYAEPTSKIKVNNVNGMIVSIQMKTGNNIVKFGEEIENKIEEFRQTVPSDVVVTKIADQPKIVDHNISHFMREFFLAIVAVVIVIILLLPFRIALVAAMAIPMTVALTLALMNFFGIELHQVSLAALIVVLGLVVDDAIVVADNYVELLDKGQTRWDAAWKSASDLILPIFVATLTIIFAFMPMVLLSGTVGEFIRTLPITVAISLGSSFIVAMVLTPLLCYTFIKKGLHDHSNPDKKQKKSLLDGMQTGYNSLLDWSIRHPKTIIIGSIIPIFIALILFGTSIKQKFFPAAERNQFVIELWMPTGTHFNATEKAVEKIEKLFSNDKRVESHTAFIGNSAPRFYYNFSPEVPVSNYAQILITTTTEETTNELAEELPSKLEKTVPEGSPVVKLMQQGAPLKATIEVRIWGENIALLKEIGARVDSIIKTKKGHQHVDTDFKEDYYGLDIHLKPEAERLGFTTEMIANSLYAGFTGAPITTIREGSNSVNVLFRLDEQERQTSADIKKLYLTSPVTHASVPLEQVAELIPVWKTGKIMHRNGLRVLTVQSGTTSEFVPSQLMLKIKPDIEKLKLPFGYKITYGGEEENQGETFPEMMGVMGIGMLLIFFIVLFQFRSLKEATIIMMTIPLSLFGAVFGLFITHNNFGFTAFVGLISLSGVVVRNAIILIDHIHELVKHEGMGMREAAIESGKRRLRPIFLTAMAAAIGVLPMILSGSQMWSPLASVIAMGVIWSMTIGLLFIPVVYLLWVVPKEETISETKKIDE